MKQSISADRHLNKTHVLYFMMSTTAETTQCFLGLTLPLQGHMELLFPRRENALSLVSVMTIDYIDADLKKCFKY